jgi:nucleoside-diphosphate-sugar epimerase
MSKMRILILGAQGRIGKMMQAAWRDQSACELIWHGRKTGDVCFDILEDTGLLQDTIRPVDLVLNLAGATHHSDTRIADVNQRLAQQVLECSGGTPVLLLSSAAVYGAQSGRLSEETPLHPIAPYGHDKAAMEQVATDYKNATVLRLGNVLGADALLGTDRDVYSLDRFENGLSPRRSYIGPNQLGDVFMRLFDQINHLPKIINVATPRPVAMADLLDVTGKNWTPTPAPSQAIEEVSLDTSKLETLYQFETIDSDAEALVKDWQSVSNII